METEIIEALINESLGHIKAGQIRAGLRKAQRAQRLANISESPRWMAAAMIAVANANFRLGNYPYARSLANQAAQLAGQITGEHCEDPVCVRTEIQAECCSILGRCAAETDDLTAGYEYLQQAAQLSRQTDNILLTIQTLHSLAAGIYVPRGQYELALATEEEVLSLARENSIHELLERPLVTMSWVAYLSGQAGLAVPYLAELSSLVEPDSLYDGWRHCIEAWLSLDQGDLGAAKIGFEQTLLIGEKIGSPELDIYSRLGLAGYYRKIENPLCALDWALEAVKKAGSIGYHHVLGRATLDCGLCAWQYGAAGQAEDYFRTALKLLIPLDARLEITQANLALASLLLSENRPEAKEAVRQALEMIRATNLTFIIHQERKMAYPVLAAGLNSRDKSLADLAGKLIRELQKVPAPPLKITSLGGLQVWQGERQIPPKALANRRAGELLALLVSSSQARIEVEQAAEKLFPERSTTAALDVIHQATSALRRALEPDLPARFPSRYICVEDGRIQLTIPPGMDLEARVDFLDFQNACSKREWDRALAIYQGEFLADCHPEEWILSLRQHIEHLYHRALMEKAHQCFLTGDFSGCLEHVHKLIRVDPWQEQAVLLGMRAAVKVDNVAAARRLYQDLCATLNADLGSKPQPEVQKFFHGLDTQESAPLDPPKDNSSLPG